MVPRFFRTFFFFRASEYIGEVVGNSLLRQVENPAIRVRTTISRTRYRAPLAMISLSHLDAFQALGFLDVEALSSTLSLHISGELLKKIPALTIPCFINKSLMFSAPPFHCGDFECSGR